MFFGLRKSVWALAEALGSHELSLAMNYRVLIYYDECPRWHTIRTCFTVGSKYPSEIWFEVLFLHLNSLSVPRWDNRTARQRTCRPTSSYAEAKKMKLTPLNFFIFDLVIHLYYF